MDQIGKWMIDKQKYEIYVKFTEDGNCRVVT